MLIRFPAIEGLKLSNQIAVHNRLCNGIISDFSLAYLLPRCFSELADRVSDVVALRPLFT